MSEKMCKNQSTTCETLKCKNLIILFDHMCLDWPILEALQLIQLGEIHHRNRTICQ